MLLPEVISFQMQDLAFPELFDVLLDSSPQPAGTYEWGSQLALLLAGGLGVPLNLLFAKLLTMSS